MPRSDASPAVPARSRARKRPMRQERPRAAQAAHPHRPGRNVLAVAEMERAGRAEQPSSERLVCRAAAWSGTVLFLWLQVAGIATWIAFNSWPGLRHVDPFPYVLLTLVLSVEAIFLSIFILISQNEETRLTERRNALDLQINLLSEQEATRALRMLRQIGDKLGVHFDADPQIRALERATDPRALVEEIDAITRRKRG